MRVTNRGPSNVRVHRNGRSWLMSKIVARRLGLYGDDPLSGELKSRLAFRRVPRPRRGMQGRRLITVVCDQRTRYDASYCLIFGPDQVHFVCGTIERILGIRMKTGEVRIYEVKASV